MRDNDTIPDHPVCIHDDYIAHNDASVLENVYQMCKERVRNFSVLQRVRLSILGFSICL
jgi:hypothetical protein